MHRVRAAGWAPALRRQRLPRDAAPARRVTTARPRAASPRAHAVRAHPVACAREESRRPVRQRGCAGRRARVGARRGDGRRSPVARVGPPPIIGNRRERRFGRAFACDGRRRRPHLPNARHASCSDGVRGGVDAGIDGELRHRSDRPRTSDAAGLDSARLRHARARRYPDSVRASRDERRTTRSRHRPQRTGWRCRAVAILGARRATVRREASRAEEAHR